MSLNKIYLGIYAVILFLASVLIFGALEPDYSHKLNSVSSLGAFSAANTLVFNILGLMLPGLLISISFYDQYLNVAIHKVEKFAYLSMVVFGVMFAGLALPMDMDPLPRVGETAHYILAYTSVFPYLISSVLYLYAVKKYLRKLPWALVLPAMFVVIDMLKSGGIIASGTGQRGLLACLFLWVALVCVRSAKKT